MLIVVIGVSGMGLNNRGIYETEYGYQEER